MLTLKVEDESLLDGLYPFPELELGKKFKVTYTYTTNESTHHKMVFTTLCGIKKDLSDKVIELEFLHIDFQGSYALLTSIEEIRSNKVRRVG